MDENKDIKFKNTSKMDEKEISIFQNYALKKRILICSIVFALAFVLLGVGLYFVDLTMSIILIVCGIVGGFVLLPYLMKETVKKQNNIILGDRKYLNTFEFFDEYVNITSEATSTKESNDYQFVASQKLYYKDIFKFVTFQERLFIFINAQQSFILHYKGMTKSTAEELVEFLKGKGIKMIDKSKMPVPVINKK